MKEKDEANTLNNMVSLLEYRKKKEALRAQRRKKRKTILRIILRMNPAMRKRFFRAKRYSEKVLGEKIESNNDFVLIGLFTYIAQCEKELKRGRSRRKK